MKDRTPGKKGDGATGPSKKGIFKLGEENEYRIARLFVWMGYFVRRGREIYTEGRLDQATDLDVLALRYRAPFSREVITIESKPGGEGPLDRVFWLSGVRQFVNADRALLYRPSTKWNIRDFAKKAGVEILDPNRLAALENRYVFEPKNWLGLCDWQFLKERLDSWNKVFSTQPKYKELYQTLVTEIRYDEPFALIAFWIHHLRGLTRDLVRETGSAQELVKYLIADAVGQLAVFFLRVVQSAADLPQLDRKGMVSKKLVYGEQEPRLADRVFENSYQIAKAAIREKLGTDIEIDRSLFIVPKPDYVDEVVELIEELTAETGISTDLPQIIDIIMSEWFLKGNKEERRVLKRIFPGEGLAQRTIAAQGLLRRLRKLEALPKDIDELLVLKQSKPAMDENKVTPEQGTFSL